MLDTEDVKSGKAKVVDFHTTHPLLSEGAGNFSHLEDARRIPDEL